MKLKSIRDQVVVVTGASSGIGRETAFRFAERGAASPASLPSSPSTSPATISPACPGCSTPEAAAAGNDQPLSENPSRASIERIRFSPCRFFSGGVVTDPAWISAALTASHPQAMAGLQRAFRDLDRAEEAYQEAVCAR